MSDQNLGGSAPGSGLLGWIERIGNKLPDPATLFLIGTIVVMALSHLAVTQDWEVVHQRPYKVEGDEGSASVEWRVVEETVAVEEDAPDGTTTTSEVTRPVVSRPTSLLAPDGLFWMLQNMVTNFTGFAPLGVVLVGMLGIGIAERVGLIGVLLKYLMQLVPGRLLTPSMVFLGIMSSMGIDAGYVVLPPLAAALYKAVGRSPLAGIAAVFAGVAAGFNANLFVTGLDPMLAGFATTGAQVLDPSRVVAPPCNWWFMIASTFVITLVGWWTTSAFVERRLSRAAPEDGGPSPPTQSELAEHAVRPEEKRALGVAASVFFAALVLVLCSTFVPGWPLHGQGALFARWVEAIVPLIMLFFLLPAIAYGVSIGKLRNDKDAAKMLVDSIAAMAPIIILAFFAAQFIEGFKHSGLDRMLALAGGQALGRADLPREALIVAFIGVTIVFNLFVGSMSAKYAMFAPIFIPMFMMVGISPELTQAAYRIGDSVSNSITPLNAYLVIVLVFMRQYVPKAGMGTLVSTMVPYTITFGIVWTIMLVVWMLLGIPLGPDGPLWYELPQ